MGRQYRPILSVAGPEEGGLTTPEPELDFDLDLAGNSAAIEALGASAPSEPAPPAPPALPGGGGGDPLPYWAEMEDAFGADFGDLRVELGVPGLRALGAAAIATDDTIAFREQNPDRETVAHELAHVLQARGAETELVSTGTSGAEAEADAVAARVAAGGEAGPVVASRSARVHRDASGPAPSPRVKSLEGRTWLVVPDASKDALANRAETSDVLSETEYRRKVDALADALVDRVAALVQDPATWVDGRSAPAVALVEAADGDVQNAAYRRLGDRRIGGGDITLSTILAAELDPVGRLWTLVGQAPPVLVPQAVTAWALKYGPDGCARALQDGRLHVVLGKRLGYETAVWVTMILLGNGIVANTAENRMLTGLHTHDAAKLLVAWRELEKEDPAAYAARMQDAQFFRLVREWTPDAYDAVMASVAAFGAPKDEPARDVVGDTGVYSDAVTDVERQRLQPVLDRHAGLLGATVRDKEVDRAFVDRALSDAEGEIRRTVEPRQKDGASLAAWDRKVRGLMVELDGTVATRFGSIRRALQEGSGDAADERSALTRIGARGDAAADLKTATVAKIRGDASVAAAWLETFTGQVRDIAAGFGAAFAPLLRARPVPTSGIEVVTKEVPSRLSSVDDQVSDALVLTLAQRFGALADLYPKSVPGGTRADATRFLTTAFAPIGGALAPHVVSGAPGVAEPALAALGLHANGYGGTQAADKAAVDASIATGAPLATRQEAVPEFQDRMLPHVASFSRMLAQLGQPQGAMYYALLPAVLTTARRVVGLARLAVGGDALLLRLWVERMGLELTEDLGLHLVRPEDRASVAAVFGVAESALAKPRSLPDDATLLATPGAVPERQKFLAKLQISPNEVSPEFDYLAAHRRAVALHSAIVRLPESQDELQSALDGRPAEMRAVRAVYREVYGYDPLYSLRQQYPDDTDRVNEIAARFRNAGEGTAALPLLVTARHHDLAGTLRTLYGMTQGQRDAVLANPAALAELATLLPTGYDTIYQALLGKLSLHDVVRNSTKDRVAEDVERWFRGRREALLQDPDLRAKALGNAELLGRMVDQQLEREGRQAFADPSVRAVVEDLKERDRRDVEYRMLGGGKLTAPGQAMVAVAGSGTDEAKLKSATSELTDSERGRMRRDPLAQVRIAEDLEGGGSDDVDADIVYGRIHRPGGGEMGALDATRSQSAGIGYDARSALDVILAMSPAGLDELRRDATKLARVRQALFGQELDTLDRYLAATRGLEGNERRGDFLVEQYVARFLAQPSKKGAVLKTAQACFAVGEIPGEPGQAFGVAERRKIWDRVGSKLEISAQALVVVEASLLRGVDPTMNIIAEGFDGKDRDGMILDAIDNAPAAQVVEWSNIRRPGPTDEYGTLAQKLKDYLDAHRAYVATRDTDREREAAHGRMVVAQNRFLDHRLDLAADTERWFALGGLDRGDPASPRQMLEIKKRIRARILGLSEGAVAKAVGLSDPEDAGVAGLLMSPDRLARSGLQQRRDEFEHHGRSKGVGTDRQKQAYVDAYGAYQVRMNNELAHGQLSPDAVRRVNELGGDTDKRLAELKEAQAKLIEVLELIATLLILAVAAALTGGAAFGFLGQLIVAGSTSLVHSGIEEMVAPEDHTLGEAGDELFRSLAVTALTLGMAKGLGAAAAPVVKGAPIQQVATFQRNLVAKTSEGLLGMPLKALSISAQSAAFAPLNATSEAVFELVDPRTWTYSFDDWVGNAQQVFWGSMGTIPEQVKLGILSEVAGKAGLRANARIGGRPPPNPVPRSPARGGSDAQNPKSTRIGELATFDGHRWMVVGDEHDAVVLAREEGGKQIRRRVTNDELFRTPANDHLLDPLPAETVGMGERATDRAEAQHMYAESIAQDPTREVALYRNSVTGEFVVIQGEPRTVQVEPGSGPRGSGHDQRWKTDLRPDDRGYWVLERHYHPPVGPGRLHQLPSDGWGDMGIVFADAMEVGRTVTAHIDTYTPWGTPTVTTYGYSPVEGTFFVQFEVSPGQMVTEKFGKIADYHAFVHQHGGTLRAPPHWAAWAPEALPPRTQAGDPDNQAAEPLSSRALALRGRLTDINERLEKLPARQRGALPARLVRVQSDAARIAKEAEAGGTPDEPEVARTEQALAAIERDLAAVERAVAPAEVVETPFDADAEAKALGYRKVNGERSHGQPVYTNGSTFISPDVGSGKGTGGSHNGGVWKMANSVENLGRRETRMGTYDAQLNRIGA